MRYSYTLLVDGDAVCKTYSHSMVIVLARALYRMYPEYRISYLDSRGVELNLLNINGKYYEKR